jgi:predicted anti-sigma-YlaC factor YlaD
MKPCSKNRKLIAWLALDAVDVRQARQLRTHLDTCEGCRRYLEEISNVTERLTATEMTSDIQASESFHQKVAGKLRVEKPNSFGEIVAAYFCGAMSCWRVALPVSAALVVAVVAFATLRKRPDVSSQAQSPAQAVPAPNWNRDLSPTIANYQMVASRSLEQLDELLTSQGNRNLSPAQIYTASSLAFANEPD